MTEPKTIDLTGCLVPFFEGAPIIVRPVPLDGMVLDFATVLPIFSTRDKLMRFMERCEVPFDSVRKITDGNELMNQIPREIGIAHDIAFLPDGSSKFQQVDRGD